MLVGLGTGIAATILFATYNERKFKRVTERTRNMGSRTGEYLHNVEDNVLGKADDLIESARTRALRAAKGTRDAVNNSTHSAEESVNRLADSAHKSIEAHMNEPRKAS